MAAVDDHPCVRSIFIPADLIVMIRAPDPQIIANDMGRVDLERVDGLGWGAGWKAADTEKNIR